LVIRSRQKNERLSRACSALVQKEFYSPGTSTTAMNNPDVAILVGSTSDMYVAEKAIEVLEDAGVAYDLEVISAASRANAPR